MLAQPDSHGKQCMRWVREAGGREDRAAADISVIDAVEAQVGIDDGGSRRGGHAHSSHVVVAVVATAEKIGAAGDEIGVRDNPGEASERALSDLDVMADRCDLLLRYLPVETGTEKSKRVAAAGECNAAAAGGLLLAVDAEEDARVGGIVGAVLEAGA